MRNQDGHYRSKIIRRIKWDRCRNEEIQQIKQEPIIKIVKKETTKKDGQSQEKWWKSKAQSKQGDQEEEFIKVPFKHL